MKVLPFVQKPEPSDDELDRAIAAADAFDAAYRQWRDRDEIERDINETLKEDE